MRRHLIGNPRGPDWEFEGEEIIHQVGNDIGGVTVYRTSGGTYVVRQVRSATGGREPLNRLAKFEDLQELAEWIGHSPDAKLLLRELGYGATINIA